MGCEPLKSRVFSFTFSFIFFYFILIYYRMMDVPPINHEIQEAWSLNTLQGQNSLHNSVQLPQFSVLSYRKSRGIPYFFDDEVSEVI